jgi:hypothetical protein
VLQVGILIITGVYQVHMLKNFFKTVKLFWGRFLQLKVFLYKIYH